MSADSIIVLVILIMGIASSVVTGKLDLPAALTGGLTGFLIYIGAGFTGIAMLAAFFVLGSFATSWKIGRKENLMIAEKNHGKREVGQVLANSGCAAILGLMVLFFPEERDLFRLMIAASLAAATSDTLSSELGNLYGRKFFNILSFKTDQRGLDGVISLEGSLFGFAGAMLIACIYAIGVGWSMQWIWIVLGGTMGNITDSLLGAALERKNLIHNNGVNFINTVVGAVSAMLLFLLTR